MYISLLAGVVRSLGISHHQYADDTQIYIAATKEDLSSRIGLLEQCTNRVHSWLLQNGLQLNPLKSEAIHFTTSRGRQRADDVTSVTVSDATIKNGDDGEKPWRNARQPSDIRPARYQRLQIVPFSCTRIATCPSVAAT